MTKSDPLAGVSSADASTLFDRYKDSYRKEVEKAIGFCGQDLDFYARIKARALLELTARHLGDPRHLAFLDIGCGIGVTDRFLLPHVRELRGVDTSVDSVRAAALANEAAEYRSYDGRTLPYLDSTFDVSFVFNVIHHIHMPERPQFVREMARVTRIGGLVVVIEQNPLNPLTRLAVSRCAFDDGCELARRRAVVALFSSIHGTVLESRYVMFFPWRGGLFRRLECHLRHVPFGAQYLVATRRER